MATPKPPEPPEVPASAPLGSSSPRPTTSADKVIESKEDEKGKVSAGRRGINLIWETTQATVTVRATTIVLVVAAILAVFGGSSIHIGDAIIQINGGVAIAAFLLLSNALTMILSVYYTRTNHTREGGVPPDATGR